ncbi:MAG: hypothetical protein ACQEP9_09200 [Bacillota bacterium]
MSGELEIAVEAISKVGEMIKGEIEARRARKRKLKESRLRLEQSREKFTSSLDDLDNTVSNLEEQRQNSKEVLEQVKDNTKEVEEDIKKMQQKKNLTLQKFKKERVKGINELVQQSKELDINFSMDAEDTIKKINNSDDKLDIIEAYTNFKAKAESEIEEKIEEEENELRQYEKFGIESEADLADEEKVAMLNMYQELKNMGYQPVYDEEEEKIIVEKENGDQIVTAQEEDKLTLQFHDYHGKDCVTDMRKIEQELKNNGTLEEGTRVYTNWYTAEEKERNKEAVLQNKTIYEEYNRQNNKSKKKSKKRNS